MGIVQTEKPQIYQSPDLFRLIVVLLKHKFYIIGSGVITAIIVVVFSKNFVIPLYESTARILPPKINSFTATSLLSKVGGSSVFADSSAGIRMPSDLYIGIFRSRSILEHVATEVDLFSVYQLEDENQVYKHLKEKTDVSANRDGIVFITVRDASPQRAAEIANAYVEAFYVLSESLSEQEVERHRSFYNRLLEEAQEKLSRVEQQLLDLEKKNRYFDADGIDKAILERRSKINEDIRALEMKRQKVLSYATSYHPDVIAISHQIAALQKTRKSLVQPDQEGQPNLSNLPEVINKRVQLQRRVKMYEDMVALIHENSSLGQVDSQRELSVVKVLDLAVPVPVQVSPNTKVDALVSMFAAMFLTIIIVLIKDYIYSASEYKKAQLRKIFFLLCEFRILK